MKKFIATTVLALSSALFAGELTGRDIMVKVSDVPEGDTRSSEMDMKLISKNGSVRERKITSFAMEEGKITKQVMFFTYPKDVKGTGFLTVDYDEVGKSDDQWLYLPAMKKTRRISGSSSKTDYFMGSDFTYDDIGERNVDEDNHKYLRDEKVDGFDCYVVESTPKNPADEVFSKKIMWIRKDILKVVAVDYFDKMGSLQRKFKTGDIKQIDGFWTIGKMRIDNVQTNHATELQFNNVKYNVKVDPKTFTVNKLERGI